MIYDAHITGDEEYAPELKRLGITLGPYDPKRGWSDCRIPEMALEGLEALRGRVLWELRMPKPGSR